MLKNKSSLIVASLLLTSCASSNVGSNWQCPTPGVKGQQCRNIASADNMAKGKENSSADNIVVEKDLIVLLNNNETIKDPVSGDSIRTDEKISRIWFAPFIDKYSNRHEASFIQIIDKSSTWR
ncbi:MAG: hypothetical protein O2970_11820 [Proteobacteria bacterium]|nr:hypothetical protein [Pseudomonadota bacterium]